MADPSIPINTGTKAEVKKIDRRWMAYRRVWHPENQRWSHHASACNSWQEAFRAAEELTKL